MQGPPGAVVHFRVLLDIAEIPKFRYESDHRASPMRYELARSHIPYVSARELLEARQKHQIYDARPTW